METSHIIIVQNQDTDIIQPPDLTQIFLELLFWVYGLSGARNGLRHYTFHDEKTRSGDDEGLPKVRVLRSSKNNTKSERASFLRDRTCIWIRLIFQNPMRNSVRTFKIFSKDLWNSPISSYLVRSIHIFVHIIFHLSRIPKAFLFFFLKKGPPTGLFKIFKHITAAVIW